MVRRSKFVNPYKYKLSQTEPLWDRVSHWDAIPYIQGFRDLLLISSDCLTVLLPSLFIILYFSLLSCLAPSKRGRARMERKRTTMGEAAQIRCKSALPPPVYIPPIATLRFPLCAPKLQFQCATHAATEPKINV